MCRQTLHLMILLLLLSVVVAVDVKHWLNVCLRTNVSFFLLFLFYSIMCRYHMHEKYSHDDQTHTRSESAFNGILNIIRLHENHVRQPSLWVTLEDRYFGRVLRFCGILKEFTGFRTETFIFEDLRQICFIITHWNWHFLRFLGHKVDTTILVLLEGNIILPHSYFTS